MELDSFEFDDAFMFIRYAENILSGNGFTWNAGDPAIFGCTSILYTYMVSLSKFLFGGFAGNSWILVGTALFFGMAFLIELQAGLYKSLRSSLLKDRLVLAVLTIPFIVLPLIFGFQVSTGMETTLSLFLHTGFIFSVIRYGNQEDKDRKWLGLAGITTYLIYLVRPDNALVAALFPMGYFISRKQYRHLIKWIVLAGAFLVLDSVVKYIAFGSLLPLSYYAKKSGFTEGYTAKYFWNPVKYLTQFIAYMMPYILVIFVFVRKKHRLLLSAFLLPVTGTFLYFFTFDQIMGFNARLYFPFIPYIIVPAFLLMDDYFMESNTKRIGMWKPNALFPKLLLLIAFLFVAVFSKYRFINMYSSYAIKAGNEQAIAIPNIDDRRYNREVSIRKLSDLLKEYPDDLVFAATEHGFISGDNPNKRIMDLSGLHNSAIARNGYFDDMLKQEQPDLIWMPHHDLTVLHHSIRTGAYFEAQYEYITNVYAFGCAIRKDSPYYERLKADIR